MKTVKCADCSATINLVHCDECTVIRCELCHYGGQHRCVMWEADLREKIVELLGRSVPVNILPAPVPTYPIAPYPQPWPLDGPRWRECEIVCHRDGPGL